MDIVSRREAGQALKWAAEFVERATKTARVRIDRPVKVRARHTKREKQAFLDAGEATFGERE